MKRSTIRNSFQEFYLKLIRYADHHYKQSIIPEYKMLQREFLSKAEAFEAAADLYYSEFQDYIIPKTTIRFNEIREHHLEENTDEPKEKIHE